jgi:hypothetical protein
MKKVICTLSLIALFTAGVFAQVSVGLKAGLNLANQKFDADGISISPDLLVGFHVGGYVNIAPSDKFSIQPELLFNSVGSKFDTGSGDKTDLKFSYISVPIMFKYSPVPIFNVQAGPQASFLMSAKADSEDIKDSFKGLDLGLAVGAGVDLPMGLSFTARYIAGLANIADDSSGSDFEGVKVKNNVIQFSVGYKLFGGK